VVRTIKFYVFYVNECAFERRGPNSHEEQASASCLSKQTNLQKYTIMNQTSPSQPTTDLDGLMPVPGRRFPTVISADGYRALGFLTDEDVGIGRQIFEQTKMANIAGVQQPADHMAVQLVNPYMLFQSDPKLFAADLDYAEKLSVLVFGMNNQEVMAATDPDKLPQDPHVLRRYNAAMLITAKVAHEYEDEWTLRLVATGPGWSLSRQQLMLLGQPQSSVWDEEQRMILEFTSAVIRRQVTDEIFQITEAMWGRQQLLRYGAWITRYVSLLMFDHINIADSERQGRD
jgi:hypothetical protein